MTKRGCMKAISGAAWKQIKVEVKVKVKKNKKITLTGITVPAK